ncbi:ATP-grasp domain-containing protein [Photobacterium sp. WH77]|uniref:ATP-grasp domain-containing protein n=1 Tax=unclassified Photobacterium TaxID=2628852 RepID=UPI001C43FE11|nr:MULTISPECIES: ATP-grasp domain-containing protein [unclassified Photobacterium]MBV7262658.1 ATP-grasp domain-containing protein [Photobacterium sp. WH24]MCG2837787.1 ATP-grasp domain-containing protein [Photobacterium sp. WH77]MCG2845403.1 ATP-grasp domain-containing protein [Photobacterium sp. WH80]MDO6582185.1 ATP-grasp domain-containing protein [Photobacterium sp. 2_MG-2023]
MMNIVAIVDPYSSGQYLANEFFGRGYACVCIHSSVDIPDAFKGSYFKDNFVDYIHFNEENRSEILDFIKTFECKAIVPGSESGVLLANQLANEAGLPGCEPSLLICLRDKYLMQERIAQVGLRSISQVRTSDYETLIPWIEKNQIEKVVIKPISSAGTDSVKFCENTDQIQMAMDEIIGKRDLLGNYNDDVLAQQYISGNEYVVDSVSLDGFHYVTNVSLYRKEKLHSGAIVYVEEIFIHPSTIEVTAIVDYAKAVLDALGICFGAAHIEIMFDDEGPVLIEVGARLHGAKAPRNVQFFSDVSQLDLLVDAAIDPERFKERTSKPPVWSKHSKAVSLINYETGKVSSIPGKKWAGTLSSYTLSFWNIEVGQEIKETSNLFDSPGGIFLANQSLQALESDTQRIREMENAGKLWILE